jgi:hypothetical protein
MARSPSLSGTAQSHRVTVSRVLPGAMSAVMLTSRWSMTA